MCVLPSIPAAANDTHNGLNAVLHKSSFYRFRVGHHRLVQQKERERERAHTQGDSQQKRDKKGKGSSALSLSLVVCVQCAEEGRKGNVFIALVCTCVHTHSGATPNNTKDMSIITGAASKEGRDWGRKKKKQRYIPLLPPTRVQICSLMLSSSWSLSLEDILLWDGCYELPPFLCITLLPYLSKYVYVRHTRVGVHIKSFDGRERTSSLISLSFGPPVPMQCASRLHVLSSINFFSSGALLPLLSRRVLLLP